MKTNIHYLTPQNICKPHLMSSDSVVLLRFSYWPTAAVILIILQQNLNAYVQINVLKAVDFNLLLLTATCYVGNENFGFIM
jgi:hypothetical protein